MAESAPAQEADSWAPRSAPGWLELAEVGHWYRISGDAPDLGLPATPPGTRFLADGDPARDPLLNPLRGPKMRLKRWLGRQVRAPWSGRSGFTAITEAWNGAVFASRFGASGAMVVFGGGHDDYFGSDVHVFDLAQRQWRRISDGYVSDQPQDYGQGAVYPAAVYPDGSPLPPHSYGYVQYDPVGNDFLLFKGQVELGPNVAAAPIPHMFNLDSGIWRHGPKHPEAVLTSGGCTAWNAARRTLWGHAGSGGQGFLGFCPDGDNGDGTWGHWGPLYTSKLAAGADHNAMTIDTMRDILVLALHEADALAALNPADPGKAIARLDSLGSKPIITPYCALEFAPSLDALVFYSANHGADVYAIKAPSGSGWLELTAGKWTWQSLLAEDNKLDPIADAAAASRHGINRDHTFRRFRIASYGAMDIAILVRHIDSPVYVMRLT